MNSFLFTWNLTLKTSLITSVVVLMVLVMMIYHHFILGVILSFSVALLSDSSKWLFWLYCLSTM